MFLAPLNSRADTLADAALALAAKVASIRNLHGPFALDWANNSSLESSQSDALRAQFLVRLAALHVALTDDPSATPLRVSLGETPTLLVFAASVRVAEEEQVRFVVAPRAAYSPEDIGPAIPRMLKQLLWKQRERVLDAAEIPGTQSDAAGLLVLSGNSLALLRQSNDSWALQSISAIPGATPASRAPQGSIRFLPEQTNNFVLRLPDKVCNGALGSSLSLNCSPDQSGGLGSASPVSPLLVLQKPTSLSAPCDNLPWTLSSGNGDWTAPDHFLLQDPRSSTPAPSASLDVPGPILSISPGSDIRTSLAVIFNLSTGNYEVYRVTLACGN